MIFSSPLSKILEEFGQIIDESARGWNSVCPNVAVNIWSNDKEVVVQAELPGIDAKNIDVSILKDRLTIKAERTLDIPEESNVHQNERRAQPIERSIQLPFEVDANSAKAEYKDGILHLTIARVHDEQPKSIKVKVK